MFSEDPKQQKAKKDIFNKKGRTRDFAEPQNLEIRIK